MLNPRHHLLLATALAGAAARGADERRREDPYDERPHRGRRFT